MRKAITVHYIFMAVKCQLGRKKYGYASWVLGTDAGADSSAGCPLGFSGHKKF